MDNFKFIYKILRALEYLSENSIMQKLYDATKGAVELIPKTLPL